MHFRDPRLRETVAHGALLAAVPGARCAPAGPPGERHRRGHRPARRGESVGRAHDYVFLIPS